jgi:thymidylate synthase
MEAKTMATVIEGKTCAEVWERSVTFLLKRGEYVPSGRGPVLECLDMALVVTRPWEEPRLSKLSPMFNQAEEFSSSLRTHPRVMNWDGVDQLKHVIDTFREDPLSRRAIISIWDPRRDLHVENAQGVIAFVFSIRNNALRLTSIFRTTDAWMCNWTLAGVPELQRVVYNELRQHAVFDNLSMGQYTQMHASFHIYLDELKNAELKLLRPSAKVNERT